MNKKIIGVFNVTSSDPEVFITNVISNVKKLQDDNQEVEIQYSTNYTDVSEFPMVYSALIIGRK